MIINLKSIDVDLEFFADVIREDVDGYVVEITPKHSDPYILFFSSFEEMKKRIDIDSKYCDARWVRFHLQRREK